MVYGCHAIVPLCCDLLVITCILVLIRGIRMTGSHKAGVKDGIVEAEVKVRLLGVVAGRWKKYPELGRQLHLHILVLLPGGFLLLGLEWGEVRPDVHAGCGL